MKKKLISTLLTIVLLTSLLPTAFAANTVTRAEWISQLVAAFSMTVEDDTTMPDNYFSDITESDSYYRDILLAVEFGVIDLEAGEAFEPNEPATREFAAQTLNSCLQFQLNEGTEYTYSEADSVTYPDDIQIAVNRNWFALSGGKFLPEQAITSAEATAMLADAKAVIASEAIDTNYDSKFEFAEGVIVVPETAQTSIDENNTVTITDYNAQIAVGDTFVVYNSGYPIALKALSVDLSDNTTVISAEKDDDAITSADAEGDIDIDLENFDANELSTYSITNTETAENEDMTVELCGISYDKGSKTLNASQKISVGSAAAGTVTVSLKNLKLSHKENAKRKSAEAVITANTTVTTEVSFDFGSYAGIPSSITLGAVPIAGVGAVALEMEYSLKGGVSMSWDGKLKAGFSYNNGDLRLVKSYTKKGFSFTAEAEIKAGLRLSAVVDLVAVKGSVYGTVGVKMNFKLNSFDSGTPKSCVTIKGYMYAQVGATASVFGQNIPIKPQDIFTESNSPVRVVYHYEDHILVPSCSRGLSLKYTTSASSGYFNPSPSYGQGSYGGGEGVAPVIIWEYEVENGNATITKYNGNASAVAIPSTIDGYTVTKIGDSAFKGNKAIKTVTMPNSIVEIGNSAFSECISLSSVILSESLTKLEYGLFENCAIITIDIPNSITNIEQNVFYSCKNLQEITLPSNLVEIGFGAFSKCDSLENIKIPKSLNKINTYSSWTYGNAGVFYDCANLKDITFETGTTSVIDYLLCGCNHLESIYLPDSITTIGNNAFSYCTALENIKFSENLTNIGSDAFNHCISLSNIELPEYLMEIDYGAFYNCSSITTLNIPKYVTTIGINTFANCSNLQQVQLPPSLEQIGFGVFSGCTSLESIEIPKTLKKVNTYSTWTVGEAGPFYNCPNLKEITLENGTTTVVKYLFSGCKSIEEIMIPKTVTNIESNAFVGCSSLKSILIPNSVTDIGSLAFYYCSALEKITLPNTLSIISSSCFYDCKSLNNIDIPNTVTEIGSYSFSGCSNLKSISLPKNLKNIKDSSFCECSKLSEINIPNTVTSIGSSAFENCDALTKIETKNASIASQAFYDCDALTTLTLGDGVTSIGYEMCYGCDSLTNVSLGKYITTIPDSAFRLCPSLTTVTLPRFCTKVAANAFAEDTKLTSAYVPVSVTSIENNSFSYPAKMTMYGKSGSYAEEYANSRNMTFSAISAPITSMSYADNAINIERYEKTIPSLNIEPAFDTSTVTFASSDEKVCTVSETGEIYGKNYGTATITAISDSGKVAATEVTVVRPPEITALKAKRNGEVYTISLTAFSVPSNGVIWVAVYDKNDCLLDIKNVYLSDNTATVDFAADDAATFRAFMWDTSTIEPITLCREINV